MSGDEGEGVSSSSSFSFPSLHHFFEGEMLYLAETTIFFVQQRCPWKAARTLQHGLPSPSSSIPLSPQPPSFLYILPFILLGDEHKQVQQHSEQATEQRPPAAYRRSRRRRFIVTQFEDIAKRINVSCLFS